MTAALVALLAGGLVWEAEIVPGLWTGEPHRLSGTVQTNFRHADVDGDGAADLVLPDRVLVQRSGRFPADAGRPIPGAERRPLADLWNGDIYLAHRDAAVRCAWRDGGLSEAQRFAVTWPPSFTAAEFDGLEASTRNETRRRRFLIDLNGDGTPECVVPVQSGLAVFAFGADRLVELGRLEVFPPARIALPARQSLWPDAERAIALPSRHMSCLYTVEPGAVVTIEERTGGGGEDESAYVVTRHRFTLNAANELSRGPSEFVREASAPRWAQPSRLNGDGVIDFAGGRTFLSDTTALAMPVFETYVDTGGADGAQTFRSRFLEPHCLFADVDNDGRLDLVSEHTRLFDGGLQETLVRAMTSRVVAHTVTVRLQDEDGRFPARPDMDVTAEIRLDSAAYKSGPMMTRYRAGRLVSILGDYNGDGLLDLAMQVAPERTAVWLNAGDRFVRQPETAPGERDAGFATVDVDGDGRSDFVFSPPSAGAGADATVYFTRGGGS